MTKKLTVAIGGLGNRGKDVYAQAVKQLGDKMELVAIADIVPSKVEEVAKLYNIPKEMCFSSLEEMVEEEQLADVMFIATQDKQHVGHAIPALRKGYHILLEKPISPDLDECREIVKVAHECNRKVVVCHVLRYTPFYTKLKELLDAGTIGDIVSVMAIENVGYWHQAHSFVRGNWCNSDETSPMILQKCCHDMDLYLWLTNKTCKTVTSFGSTYHFKSENAPEGATKRCMDGCLAKENCPYDAEKIYIENERFGAKTGYKGWPLEVLALHPTLETITEAVQKGPYGQCVYHCNNNVVDHQVVNLEMTDGSTMSFTMCGFTYDNSRYAKIMGTMGEIVADMKFNTIEVKVFGKTPEVIDINKLATNLSGHGGGDIRLVEEFGDMILEDREPTKAITSIDNSVESHYIALAAEESRLQGGACIPLDTLKK